MPYYAISLCELGPHEEGTVVALEGGRGFISRLAALGFTPGVTVDMIRNHGHGPLIVAVLDTQIALGRGEAAKIRVRPNRLVAAQQAAQAITEG